MVNLFFFSWYFDFVIRNFYSNIISINYFWFVPQWYVWKQITNKRNRKKSRQNKNWFLPLYSKQSLVQDFLRLSIPKLLLCLFWPQCCHLQALAWPWVALKKSREKKLNLGILLARTLNQPARVGTCLELFSFILKQKEFLTTLLF